jgi:hypothetical protein
MALMRLREETQFDPQKILSLPLLMVTIKFFVDQIVFPLLNALKPYLRSSNLYFVLTIWGLNIGGLLKALKK